MKIVIQRALDASCVVDGRVVSAIDKGYMLLVSFTAGDNLEIVKKMAKKVANLRIFSDEAGKMNKSILDIGGSILSISQFTLYANPYSGNRPSFTDALKFDEASKLYLEFNEILSKEYNIIVKGGEFGADMKISFTNDGPVTIILDSMYIK